MSPWVLAGLAATGCVELELPAVGGERNVCSAATRAAFLQTEAGAERADLWIAFIDVGHGDATWLRTPGVVGVDAGEILIDAGDDGLPDAPYVPDGGAAVLDLFARAGFGAGEPLDILVVTHPDKDHHGGVSSVLARHPARVFIDSGRSAEGSTWQRLQRAVDAAGSLRRVAPIDGIDPIEPGRSASHRWGRGVVARLLAADPEAPSDNEASLVFEIDYAGRRVVLLGDAEAGLEARLAERVRPADVVRTGHHGGVGTASALFIDRILPPDGRGFAIISAGGRAGLPHPDVVRRLEARVGARLLRTDRLDGALTRRASAGDDHVVMRIGGDDGRVELCYLDADPAEADP